MKDACSSMIHLVCKFSILAGIHTASYLNSSLVLIRLLPSLFTSDLYLHTVHGLSPLRMPHLFWAVHQPKSGSHD